VILGNDQVAFWKGAGGDRYTERNAITLEALKARIHLWADILVHTKHPLRSIAEVGANVGINLRAMQQVPSFYINPWLGDDARFFAVEPNQTALSRLFADGLVEFAYQDIRDMTGTFDLIFTSGVLIHIHPDHLLEFCRNIHRHSSRYIVCIEYFSAEPRMVPYRGENDRLWTRDFGSFWLDNFPDLKPIAAGFAWQRMTGLDDLTWWVLEKR